MSTMQDRVVIITGGAAGLGAAAVRKFHDAGAMVEIWDVADDRGEALASELERAAYRHVNVAESEDVAAAMQDVVDRHGRLDVLVNNAGGSPAAPAATASPRFHEAVIRLNLLGPLHFAQQANAVMQEQESGGVIVNVASVSAERPSPGTAAYGAAKAGLLSLTRSLAVEWAPKVRVVAVTAGLIRTEQAHLHYGDEEGVAAVAGTVPLGRLGTPADVADACLFLASPMAAYVSGASLLLHGGGERPAFLDAANAPEDAEEG